MTIKLGQKVRCYGYLKKVIPKKCVVKSDEKIESDNIIELKEEEFVEQNAYKVVKKGFFGYFVGTKKIAIKKNYNCEKIGKDNVYHIEKFVRPEDIREVARIYYANNKSRLVPIKMLEVINDQSKVRISNKKDD